MGPLIFVLFDRSIGSGNRSRENWTEETEISTCTSSEQMRRRESDSDSSSSSHPMTRR